MICTDKQIKFELSMLYYYRRMLTEEREKNDNLCRILSSCIGNDRETELERIAIIEGKPEDE